MTVSLKRTEMLLNALEQDGGTLCARAAFYIRETRRFMAVMTDRLEMEERRTRDQSNTIVYLNRRIKALLKDASMPDERPETEADHDT